MQLINGKILAEKIKNSIAAEIHSFNGPRPGLAIILIGEKPDSQLYVNRKEKQAKEVGIDTHVYRCDTDVSQEEIIKTIDFLNNDESVDAILVQLPLPSNFDTDLIINTIKPEKDVDGFTKINLNRLIGKNNEVGILPPVYAVILAMLESINVTLENKKVVLVANSDIFVENLDEVLRRQGAKVTLASVTDPNLVLVTTQADILISAVGKPGYITKDMIKEQAVIIDIGITMDEKGNMQGDVDFESVKNTVSFITPVPGGVGPMTIAMAFWNTLEMFKRNHQL